MATMYPPEVSEATSSNAERRIFNLIRDEVSDDWIALHSLNIARHVEKIWGEIDFVLIGPGGIYCLEVKGGRVSRNEGVWGFTNRHGETNTKNEGPFAQVQTGSQSLRNHLRKKHEWIDDGVVGWGVVLPDITFEIFDPEVEQRVLYDERDTDRPFSSYLRKLVDFWEEKLQQRLGRPVESLSGRKIFEIRDSLRGDFDVRPSLKLQIKQASAELLRLTEEQYRVLDGIAENDRVIVQGGAGTGKTLLAVQEARRLALGGKRVFFACFNRNLAIHLRKLVSDVSGIDVYHLHGYMADQVAAADLKYRLPPAEPADLFSNFYPQLTIEALVNLNLVEAYDALIIDEAQDLLLETYLELFDFMIKGSMENGWWRIFFDHNQNLFRGTAAPAMKKILEVRPATFRLNINCRNTRPIATVNSLISGVPGEALLKVEGPDVEHVWYRDPAHERREINNCLNRLLGKHISPDDIVILSHYRLENSCLADDNSTFAYPIYDISDRERPPSGDYFRYATVGSFKGLESDVVVFIDINDLVRPERLSTCYVGASRARSYLAVFVSEDCREDYEIAAQEFGRRLAGTLSGS